MRGEGGRRGMEGGDILVFAQSLHFEGKSMACFKSKSLNYIVMFALVWPE